MTARLIVIEGIDQSGKATQARLLATKLSRSGYRVRKLSYPIYTSFSGRMISSFLSGRRSIPFQALHMLYSLNRWETIDKLTSMLEHSDYLIVDRYYPSNIAYGIARGLEREWLSNLDNGLPRPDAVFLIDTPSQASFARKRRGRDRNEKDQVFLSKVRRIYRKLARKQRWSIIDGSASQREVSDKIWKIFKEDVEKQTRLPRRAKCSKTR